MEPGGRNVVAATGGSAAVVTPLAQVTTLWTPGGGGHKAGAARGYRTRDGSCTPEPQDTGPLPLPGSGH